MALLLSLLAATVPLPGQIGPYPGGYPRQPGGLPLPPLPGSGGNKPRAERASRNNVRPEVHYKGKILKLEGGSLVMKLDDGRILRMNRAGKTKFYKESKQVKASQFGPGDGISVDATQDEQGYWFALRVVLEQAATPEERTQAMAEANQRPAPAMRTPADDGRPTLKRKDSASAAQEGSREAEETRAAAPDAAHLPAAATPQPPASATIPRPVDPRGRPDELIEKARQATFAFSDKLPNFICEEIMTRFARYSSASGWRHLDVVSAEIIYEDGHESYRNLKVNHQPTSKKMEELSGSWSTGEFATTLNGLFHPETAARFRDGGDNKTPGLRGLVYDFEVDQENSHWLVNAGSQSLASAYKGSVWIDPETSRVLRVEIQARHLPPDFPMDIVESAVDYSWVPIAGEPVLMPVRAESLGCQRGTRTCSRNIIDFRNYRKYSSDSKIIFGEEEGK